MLIKENEVWKVIEDFPNYEVSQYGRVRNAKTMRVLKTWSVKNNYRRIGLSVKGKHHYLFIHRLVAFAFCDGWFEGAVVNHLDKNPSNNFYKNLKWCTQIENLEYSGIYEKPVDQYDLEGNFIRSYNSTQDASRQLGIWQSTIYGNCVRRLKKAGNFIFVWKGQPFKPYITRKEKKVNQYSKEGDFITSYQSIKEAGEITGINNRNICSCCRGKRKTAGGFI